MCNGNCGKCKKAEFETKDVQVESLAERSGMIVDDIKIGMTDGDDSQELQPTCMRAFGYDNSISTEADDGIEIKYSNVEAGLKNGDLCIARSFFGNYALTFVGMAEGLPYQNDCVVVKDGKPIPILFSELEKA